MITILSKFFIDDYKNYNDLTVRRHYGILGSITGILLNILLFIGKYLAGIISGSIAITADAFNNLSDAGSSIITLLGFKLSSKKPDPDHPFGHGRIEYLSGLLVSIIIMFMGYELMRSSISDIINPKSIDTGVISISILIFSILIKLYMFSYNRILGKKISSTVMNATALDSLTDSIATFVVLISMLLLKFADINIDGYSGIVVAIFILYAGFSSMKDTISPLLGQAPSPELVEQIENIVMSHKDILGIHDLVVHDYGPGRLMISLHGEVSGDGDIFVIHDMIDCIENELNEKLNCEAVIHMDPVDANDEKTNDMKSKISQLVKQVNNEITIHDFRMVTGPTHTNVIFDAVVPHDITYTDKEIKEELQNLVHTTYDNIFAVIKIDKSFTKHNKNH